MINSSIKLLVNISTQINDHSPIKSMTCLIKLFKLLSTITSLSNKVSDLALLIKLVINNSPTKTLR